MTTSYAEIFPIEIEGWCSGIASYPGMVSSLTVKRVISQLQPSLLLAVQSNFQFDIVAIARQFAFAGKGVVSEKQVIEWLVEVLPSPKELNEDGLYLVANVLSAASSVRGIVELYNSLHSNPAKRAA